MAKAIELVSVSLSLGTEHENILYRLKPNTTLHIHPNIESLGHEIILYSNYPMKGNEFKRTNYRILDWFLKDGKGITTNECPFVHVKDTDIYASIILNTSGTFHFWFNYKESKSQELAGGLFIQIEPQLYVGPPEQQQILPLDAICCQTVLTKLLGHFDTWEQKLRISKESGYNMIHFTPIQELGNSSSAYSIRNQLEINPNFIASTGVKPTYEDIDNLIKKIRNEWHLASISDIVLNHTANESDWLLKYPESSYSCSTCPYLRPAFLLDALLSRCGEDVSNGLLEMYGVPPIIDQECHLNALKHQLIEIYLPKIQLHELYQCNVDECVLEFLCEMRKNPPPENITKESRIKEIQLTPNIQYRRLGATIDMSLTLEIINGFHTDCFDEELRLRKCSDKLRTHLEWLNETIRREIDDYLKCAINNCLNNIRYERVQLNGPRIREISDQHPLFMRYFTQTKIIGQSLQQIERAMYTDELGKYFMAHNGWIIGEKDPLINFADLQPGRANVYLKRELIAWSDCVKLRYGDKPSDSPYLWQHMTNYVQKTAQIFDGVRLDNCHSTPIHVAEYFLDVAREVNSNLYVVAELFTNSILIDNVFVNKLGITSLIREAQSAWDAHEQGRLVYRYGGLPVGDFLIHPQRYLNASVTHALFMDLTHDNPSPIENRSIYDLLPTSAVVAMASCATGSCRGYDELVPHHIHVVNETRSYQSWNVDVNISTGIIKAKRFLNLLHAEMAAREFTQVYVDQIDENIIAVTRHCPITHENIILVAHTAFKYPLHKTDVSIRPLSFEGQLDEIILEAEFHMKGNQSFAKPSAFVKDSKFLNGYRQFQLTMREHISIKETRIFHSQINTKGSLTKLEFSNFQPGSIVIFKSSPHKHVPRNFIQQLTKAIRSQECSETYKKLQSIVNKMSLSDLSIALFMCDAEEKDMGFGGGAYIIPNYGALVYCGLQGFISVLTDISPNHDLSHPLCNNLRDGNWMLDYVSHRLSHHEGTKNLSLWLQSSFEPLKQMPRYLIPSYFDAIITEVYNVLVQHVFHLMPDFIKSGHKFVKLLALATLEFSAICTSAQLPQLSIALEPPKPTLSNFITLAAGLPHFAIGYMRCWGRDTFISLRGLMFITGRYVEARYIILAYAQCLRHGLIPNLLGGGHKPRYNCRDAVWWWLYSIKQYVDKAPQGSSLLKDKVSRIFPCDDSRPHNPGEFEQNLIDVMQEALQVHFQGLVFKERNAGAEIDAYMTEQGFQNEIGVHFETGFVFGGNQWNCGTWMDKMGSSEKANNRGYPTTPRDGTAVELVGLQYAVLRFMENLCEKGIIEYKSVTRCKTTDERTTWSYKDWADRIKDNFEKYFYVKNAKAGYKNNIYKDCFGSSHPDADNQLRCNFPISMVVAPDLFNPQHAWTALEIVRKKLLGPLGIKTLDPDDKHYRGIYDNTDSQDRATAHGANYHQGPEWLWPMGYYLRARLIFAKKQGHLKQTIYETWRILKNHLNELQTSHWRGLPELTNENGTFCKYSCSTQAWSVSSIMEVLSDLHDLDGDN